MRTAGSRRWIINKVRPSEPIEVDGGKLITGIKIGGDGGDGLAVKEMKRPGRRNESIPTDGENGLLLTGNKMIGIGKVGGVSEICIEAQKVEGRVGQENVYVTIGDYSGSSQGEMEPENFEPVGVRTVIKDLSASCGIGNIDEPGKRFVRWMLRILFNR